MVRGKSSAPRGAAGQPGLDSLVRVNGGDREQKRIARGSFTTLSPVVPLRSRESRGRIQGMLSGPWLGAYRAGESMSQAEAQPIRGRPLQLCCCLLSPTTPSPGLLPTTQRAGGPGRAATAGGYPLPARPPTTFLPILTTGLPPPRVHSKTNRVLDLSHRSDLQQVLT